MMNDENIVGSGGQANSLMSMIAKRNNDSNNNDHTQNLMNNCRVIFFLRFSIC